MAASDTCATGWTRRRGRSSAWSTRRTRRPRTPCTGRLTGSSPTRSTPSPSTPRDRRDRRWLSGAGRRRPCRPPARSAVISAVVARAGPCDHAETMSITIQLLGRPRITRGAAAGYKFRSRKSWGLLAYLILSERPAARSQLASLLFAEADDQVRARGGRLAEPYLWLDGYILDAQCDLGRRHGHPDTGAWVETLRTLASRSGMRELTLRSLRYGAALGREGDGA